MVHNFKGGKRPIVFTSSSLSFRSTTVEIFVHERNSTIQPCVNWRVGGDFFYSSKDYQLYEKLSHSVNRTTIYEHCKENCASGTLRLCSPEHLAPVFLMWPSRSFDVNLLSVKESEIPMMDGSSLPFFTKLRRQIGVPESLSFYDVPMRCEWDLVRLGKRYGYVCIEPSETFEVEYTMSAINSYAQVSIYSAEDLYTLFMARTFITESEYKAALNLGLLKGVDESSGLLLCEDSLDYKKFRIPSEPAKHKILDLLGDLSFVCPTLPKVRIEILNGGHVAHHQIIKKLLPYVSLKIAPEI